MSSDRLDLFIKLVRFDQQTASLLKRKHDLEQKSKKIDNEMIALQERADAATHSEIEARKEVDRRELEMKDLDQREKEQGRRLDNAKNAKEYEFARSEIETLKQKQSEYEEVLIDAWNALERAIAEAKKVKQNAQQEREALEQAQKKNKEEQSENNALLDERADQRSALFDVLPEEWRDTYASLAKRVSDPAVPVISESCSACFNTVTRPDMMRLARRALLQCKGCRRFLYLEEQSSS